MFFLGLTMKASIFFAYMIIYTWYHRTLNVSTSHAIPPINVEAEVLQRKVDMFFFCKSLVVFNILGPFNFGEFFLM